MPGKHVHFATEDSSFYTPALSFAASSLSSSSTPPPSTPPSFSPPVAYDGSPYACVPLPPLDPPTAVTIHPLLSPQRMSFVHELSQHPNSMHCPVPVAPHVWDEPASRPGLRSIEIICERLPWRVSIHASRPGRYVTIRDVLENLHNALRTMVTAEEFERLPTPQAKMEVSRAWQRRYKRFTVDRRRYEEEKQNGVRRVDFLGDQSRFGGFVCSSQGSNVWKLIIALP